MTESWLGARTQRTAMVVGGGGDVRVRECERVCACVRAYVHTCMRACVMCLQYTIMIFYPG